MRLLTDQVMDLSAKSHAAVVIDDTVAWNAGTGKTKQSFSQESFDRVTFPNYTRTVDTLQLLAHGISIFAQYGSHFFSDYMPYIFGGTNIVTPEDRGAYMMNFCLLTHQRRPKDMLNHILVCDVDIDIICEIIKLRETLDKTLVLSNDYKVVRLHSYGKLYEKVKTQCIEIIRSEALHYPSVKNVQRLNSNRATPKKPK